MAEFVGDKVDTTIPLHALLSGRARVWWEGAAHQPDALLILADRVPREPWFFGRDAAAVVKLLQAVPPWSAVNVSLDQAEAVAAALAAATGRAVFRYGDLYFAQHQPMPVEPHADVRELESNAHDAALLAAADDDVRPGDAAFIRLMLTEGHCTAAVRGGKIVAQTHSYCITPRFADISAKTSAIYRGRGLSTACASLLCARLHKIARIPIWSTGESNLASQRVAAKLGFESVQHRVYLHLS